MDQKVFDHELAQLMEYKDDETEQMLMSRMIDAMLRARDLFLQVEGIEGMYFPVEIIARRVAHVDNKYDYGLDEVERISYADTDWGTTTKEVDYGRRI